MIGILLIPVILSLLLSGILLDTFNPTPILASDRYEYCQSGDNASSPVYGGYWLAQGFRASDTYVLSEIRLKLYTSGSPGTLSVSLYSLTFDPFTLSWIPWYARAATTISTTGMTSDNAGAWYSAYFNYEVVNGFYYAIVLSAPAGNSSNAVHWRYDQTGSYTDGKYYSSDDGGISWNMEASYDFMFSNWGDTSASDVYEEYTTGDDSGGEMDSIYWVAQTFTTDNTPHYATGINLKAYRVGYPGTVTVSLQETDNAGHPLGIDLAVGTLDANVITDDSDGDWYNAMFSAAYSLEPCTQYAIVTRAVSGNETNMFGWRYNSVGAYAGGDCNISENSGNTWETLEDTDLMFQVLGEPSSRIVDVAVYTGYVQEGDMIFMIHYLCEVPPAWPNGIASRYYYLSVENATAPVAKVGLPAWGYKPACIYLSPQTAQSITWGKNTTITLTPYTSAWDPLPERTTLTLTLNNFVGPDLFSLDEWVLDTAALMEAYYGEDMVATSGSPYTESSTITQDMLTRTGGEIFIKGVPGLDGVRPHLFSYMEHSPEETTPTEGTNAGQKDLEDTMGTQFMEMFDAWADVIHVDNGQVVAGLFMLAMTIGATSLGMFLAQDVRGGILGAAPIVIIGFGLGFWSLAWMAMGCIVITLVFVWVFLLRGT